MEQPDRHASFDESSEPVEAKSEREEAPVWGMLPIFAVIGALLAVLVAFMPPNGGGLMFAIITLIAVIVGGAVLVFYNQQRRRGR